MNGKEITSAAGRPSDQAAFAFPSEGRGGGAPRFAPTVSFPICLARGAPPPLLFLLLPLPGLSPPAVHVTRCPSAIPLVGNRWCSAETGFLPTARRPRARPGTAPGRPVLRRGSASFAFLSRGVTWPKRSHTCHQLGGAQSFFLLWVADQLSAALGRLPPSLLSGSQTAAGAGLLGALLLVPARPKPTSLSRLLSFHLLSLSLSYRPPPRFLEFLIADGLCDWLFGSDPAWAPAWAYKKGLRRGLPSIPRSGHKGPVTA